MNRTTRREFLKTTVISGTALLAGGMTAAAVAGTPRQPARQPVKFTPVTLRRDVTVEIKGLCAKVADIDVVHVGRPTAPTKPPVDGRRLAYRPSVTGAGAEEKFAFTFQDTAANAAIVAWARQAIAAGPSARKTLQRDIVVCALARDKSTVLKTINCFAAYPISLNAGDHNTSSEVKSITLTCNVDRIEVA